MATEPETPLEHHLEGLALELTDDPTDLPQQEGPGVDEVDSIHHDGDDAVPALEASGQAVFDEEGVAEHKAVLFIAKEDRAFATRAHLGGSDSNFRPSSIQTLPKVSWVPFPVFGCARLLRTNVLSLGCTQMLQLGLLDRPEGQQMQWTTAGPAE